MNRAALRDVQDGNPHFCAITMRLLPIFAVCISSVALASGFRHRAGSESWTEPAGATGSGSVELLASPEYFGLQALKLWEFDRRLCALQIEQSSFNAPSAAPLDPLRVCEPKLTQSWKRADIGVGQFVTALSVCTAKGKDAGPELQGVELWGASLDDNGRLVPAKKSVKVELSACQKWSPKRACPKGSVATGLRGHNADERGIVGLALRCHAVESAP